LHKQTSIEREDPVFVFAFYRLTLVDARTGKKVFDMEALKEGESGSIFHSESPNKRVPFALWADSGDMFTAEQREQVKTEMKSLLSSSLAYNLKKLGLVP